MSIRVQVTIRLTQRDLDRVDALLDDDGDAVQTTRSDVLRRVLRAGLAMAERGQGRISRRMRRQTESGRASAESRA